MTTGIIIQARMSSQRLPGKSLCMIDNLPLIHHCYNRCKNANVDKVVFAVPDLVSDDCLYDYLNSHNIPVIRGDPDNLVLRFKQAADFFGINNIIRVTGDNPLIDSKLIDALLEKYNLLQVDYATTRHWNGKKFLGGYVKGLGIDIFNKLNIDIMALSELTQEEREHIVYYFYRESKNFRIYELLPKLQCKFELSVDTPGDLIRVREIYNYLNNNKLTFSYDNYCNIPEQLFKPQRSNVHTINTININEV